MSAINNKTDAEILAEIGSRLRQYRLQRNVTQQELAARAGLSRRAVYAVETGQDSMLTTLVRVLRALERLDALEAMLPPPPISPLSLLKTGTKRRLRARSKGKRRG